MAMARIRLVAAMCMTAFAATSASAQVFGTFTWQMQPFCNIVTMTITQVPSGFTIDGFDEQCGALKRASSIGMALINPDGTVGIDFTIVTAPGGKGVHVAAVISPVTGSGSWTDSVGNSGAFVLAGAVPGLSPRPLPASGIGPATITAVEIANNTITGGNVLNGSLTTADLLDGPRATFISGDQFVSITGTEVVRSLTIDAPVAGKVVVFATGIIGFTGNTAVQDFAICSITTGTAVEAAHQIAASDGGATVTSIYESFAGTRGFNVAAGAFAVNLVCQESTGSIGIGDSSLSAIFTPQ